MNIINGIREQSNFTFKLEAWDFSICVGSSSLSFMDLKLPRRHPPWGHLREHFQRGLREKGRATLNVDGTNLYIIGTG